MTRTASLTYSFDPIAHLGLFRSFPTLFQKSGPKEEVCNHSAPGAFKYASTTSADSTFKSFKAVIRNPCEHSLVPTLAYHVIDAGGSVLSPLMHILAFLVKSILMSNMIVRSISVKTNW